MDFTKPISQEVKIPGIYAVIEENILTASKITNVGKTPTIILDAPDFIYQVDTDEDSEEYVKPVRILPNSLYVIDNPKELLSTLNGDAFLDGTITNAQLESMRCPDLENALQIAMQQEKSFAFVKMVKRDGTRPDMNNLHEVFEAHEYANESLSVMNVGTIVPFGFSVQDVFELGESEAIANVQLSAGTYTTGTPYTGFTGKIYPNKYDLDIEKDFSGKIHISIDSDLGVVKPNDIADGITAKIEYENESGIKTTVAEELPVTYIPNYSFSDTYDSVPAIVLRDNETVEVEPGELTLVFNAGTLVATVGVDGGTGELKKVDDVDTPTALTTDSTGTLITNFDLSLLGAVVHTTPIGESQNFDFVATTNRNPYVKVSSITDEDYVSNIQIEQGVNDDGVRNYNPSIADTYILTFGINALKTAVSVYKNIEDKNADEPVAEGLEIVADGNFYKLVQQETVELISGVTVVLPAGLIVYEDGVSVDASLGEGIFFNLKFAVGNQPAYKINTVPYKATFNELYARFAHKLTFELDETRVVLSSGLIPSDSAAEKLKFIKKLESLKLRGSMKNVLNATKFVDLGKYISVPVGMLKSITGVGGFKPSLTVKIKDFGRTNGGAGEIEALTKTVIVADGTSFKKGDKIELQTIKQLSVITEQNEVVSVNQLTNGQYRILVKNDIDTAKFNKAAYDVTLALINKKDLKGNCTAFQYAMYSDDQDNKSLVRQYIAGVAECVFTKDMIARLDAAGYTVINYDPNSDYGFVENTPTMADTITKFTNQSTVGVIFYILRKLRAIGRSFQGMNLNLSQNQISYNDRVGEVKKDVLDKGLVVSVTITPSFAKASEGKLSASIRIREGKNLEEIIYNTLIDNAS